MKKHYCVRNILIEHHNGNLPAWLAPTQVRILPVSDTYLQHAEKIHKRLLKQGIRAEIDSNPSTISYKIRDAELQKIPYMIICGEREVKAKKVSIRKHGAGDMGLLTLREFIRALQGRQ